MGIWIKNWLAGAREKTSTVSVAGKAMEVRWSVRAAHELAKRSSPLIMELELAFACFARKEVKFHEVMDSEYDLVRVNDKLMLRVSTVIPGTCDAGAPGKSLSRSFVPHWVRIDYAKGQWVGDYGL